MGQYFRPQYQSRKERIPRELCHEWIIPYLLANYVHRYIVHDETQAWNPFNMLPLVCRYFNHSCKYFTRQIFHDNHDGEADTEPPISSRKLLDATRKIWFKAQESWIRSDSEYSQPTYGELASTKNLIQIYICAGYARYNYALKVLQPVFLEKSLLDMTDGYNPTSKITGDPDLEIPSDFRFRLYKMSHECMPEFFLPFMCAIRQCDTFKHHTMLVEPIADYLAKTVITYCTEPILLERIQTLEMNMTQCYNAEIRARLIQETLNLIQCREFLDNTTSEKSLGKIVSQYYEKKSSGFTKKTIERTRALDVLEVVALNNWGVGTESINGIATEIHEKFQEICGKEAPRALI